MNSFDRRLVVRRHIPWLFIAVTFMFTTGCQSGAPAKRGGNGSGDGLSLSGRVRDAVTAAPIDGVTVFMTRELLDEANRYRSIGPAAEVTATTDADGVFSFTLPPEQARNENLLVGFELRHPRYADTMGGEEPMSKIIEARRRGERPWFADLTMRPGEEITGVVEDPHGRPIADCIVDYSPQGQRYANGRTKTDRDGRFRFMVARGSTRNVTIARPSEYATQTFELFNRRGDVSALRVHDGAVVTGVVRDERGQPLANALVGTRAIGLFGWMTESWIRTDANGRYTLGPLLPGPHRLTVGDMRFAPLGLYLQPERATQAIDLRPAELVTIRFRVIDEAGRPATRTGPYPRVTANIAGYVNEQWYNAASASTDCDGVVTLRVPKRAGVGTFRVEGAAGGAVGACGW